MALLMTRKSYAVFRADAQHKKFALIQATFNNHATHSLPVSHIFKVRYSTLNQWSKIMAGMINCMRFRPKEGKAEALFKAFAEYTRDDPFDDIMHHIINLGGGEYALIGVHHSVESFMAIVNRENRVSEMMRAYVEPYEDGEAFHSFSGPVVSHNDYL